MPESINVKDVAGLAIFDGRRIDGDEFEEDLRKEISASTQVPDRICVYQFPQNENLPE